MQRLIICKMLESKDLEGCPGALDEGELWENCQVQLKIAREKGYEVAHIYRPDHATVSAFKICRPLPNEAIYEIEVSSLFSYHALEIFCTESPTDIVYLAGTIEQDVLLKSIRDAAYLGVTIAPHPSASIIAPRIPQISLNEESIIDFVDLCISFVRKSSRIANNYPLMACEENEEFNENLGMAEISLLRWRTSLAAQAGLLKPPSSEDNI